MGLYVNPKDRSKEQWLRENGKLQDDAPNYGSIPAGSSAVCLVDNGFMTAAGVCFSERELEAFNGPTDLRPKKWYVVEDSKLVEVGADPASYR